MDKHTQNISDMMNDLKAHFEISAEQENKEIILSGQADETLLCGRDWLIETESSIYTIFSSGFTAADFQKIRSFQRLSWKLATEV